MKAQIYRFKMEYVGYEDKINRVVDVSSNFTMAKLGYSVLAAFDTLANHLFGMTYKGKRYEIAIDEDFDESAIDLTTVKLNKLDLQVGDKIEMVYDYGCGQEFVLTFEGVSEMVKGSGPSYPKIISGAGKGILEDVFPDEFGEIIAEIDKNGVSNHKYLAPNGEEEDWDYRDFDAEIANMAAAYGAKPAEVKKIIAEQNRLGDLVATVLRRKTAQFIIDSIAE